MEQELSVVSGITIDTTATAVDAAKSPMGGARLPARRASARGSSSGKEAEAKLLKALSPKSQSGGVRIFDASSEGASSPKGGDPLISADAEEEDFESYFGYTQPAWKLFVFYFFCLATVGILPLLCFWFVSLRVLLMYSPEKDLDKATYVKAITHEKDIIIAPIFSVEYNALDGKDLKESARIVVLRCKRFVVTTTVSPLPEVDSSFSAIFLGADGTTTERADKSRQKYGALYGANEIAVPKASWLNLLLIEAFQPFYVFQYYAFALWTYEEYYSYATVVLVITLIAIVINVHQTYRNKIRLQELANVPSVTEYTSEYDRKVTKLAEATPEDNELVINTPKTKSSHELVPGDLVVIRTNQVMTCDAIILHGECIVDENILTGETLPVRKTPFDVALTASGLSYNIKTHGGNTVYAGTTVKLAHGVKSTVVNPWGEEHEPGAVAIVVRTGFNAAKGQLIRAILFPKGHDLKYNRDALLFIITMGTMGLLFYIWSGVLLYSYNATTEDIVVKLLDMIVIAVPPALACALSIATSVSVNRLEAQQVFVSDSKRINWGGLIDTVCFDKTGTLTQSGLDFSGVVVGSATSAVGVDACDELTREMLATCHGISKLKQTLVGDPLEIRLFESTGYSIEFVAERNVIQTTISNIDKSESWKILKRFEFNSEKMRSAAVVERKSDSRRVFHVKGSPEAIKSISMPESVPENFASTLVSFTRLGLRVLAYGSRELAADEDISTVIDQKTLEPGVKFGGFILLANQLKAESKETITALHDAELHVTMITGDHIRTAVAISSECGILVPGADVSIVDVNDVYSPRNRISISSDRDSLPLKCLFSSPSAADDVAVSFNEVLTKSKAGVPIAVTGRALRVIAQYNAPLFSYVVGKAFVFARMEPEDKALVVDALGIGALEDFEDIHAVHNMHYVAFCGDGANDIAALKTAMVGVSLCDAEASVAAPLTSRQQTPKIMLKILMEGRCSLVTSFVCFKFIMAYAIIQVLNACLAYGKGLTIGNNQYLIQDLFYTTVLAAAMAFTAPLDKLPSIMPPDRFMTPIIIVPVFVHFGVVFIFQFAALAMVYSQPWFTPFETIMVENGFEPLDEYVSYEGTALFIMSLGQFLIAAIVMDEGAPFRKSWLTNKFQVFAFIYQIAFLLALIWDGPWFNDECKTAMRLNSAYDLAMDKNTYSMYFPPENPAALNYTTAFTGTEEEVEAAWTMYNGTIAIRDACLPIFNEFTMCKGVSMTMECFEQIFWMNRYQDWFLDVLFEVRQFPDVLFRLYIFLLLVCNLIVAYSFDRLTKLALSKCLKPRAHAGTPAKSLKH